MSSTSVETEQYTLGVEEEYQIVDPETRDLRSHDGSELRWARRMVGEGEGAEIELLASRIEPARRRGRYADRGGGARDGRGVVG